MTTRRLASLVMIFGLLGGLGLNALWARRAAPPPWPGPVHELHTQVGANLDLAELATLDDAALAARWQALREDGVSILRVRVPWAMIQPEPDQWRWHGLDRVLAAQDVADPFRIILVLDGSPAWARAPQDRDNPYAPPQDVREFGLFAETLARHVASRRKPDTVETSPWHVAYQIWHEPNIGPHWGARYADPQGYMNLLREAYHSIHRVQPGAFILMAALAPTTTDDGFNVPDPVYLDRLLSLGAGAFFDAAAGQAYGFDQPPEAPPAAEALNFRRVELLHRVLARHGLGERPFFITAWGWWTPQAPGLDPEASPWRSIAVGTLSDYQQRAWAWARSHWPWAVGMTWVQYVAGPDEEPLRLGWVQRDAQGQRTPAGQGLATLAHMAALPGAGRYTPVQAQGYLSEPLSAEWRWSPQAADPEGPGATYVLPFRGRAVALQVQRGAFKGYFQVWVDHHPAPDLPIDPATGDAYLFLYDPDNRIATVPVARALPEGEHTLRIRAQGGWGYWPFLGVVVDDQPHPRPWPFWPITAGLTLLGLGVLAWGWHDWRPELLPACWGLTAMRREMRRLPGAAVLARGLDGIAVYGPAAALVTLPFLMRPVRLGPIGFPLHEFLIWISLAAAMGAWLLSPPASSSSQRPRSAQRLLDISLFLLLLIGFFAALNAKYRGYAFYDWRVTFLSPAVFYLVITRVTLRRPRGMYVLGHGALLGGALVSLIALGQFLTGHVGLAEGVPRVQALYGSANNLALVLGRLLPLALVLGFAPCPKAQAQREQSIHRWMGWVSALPGCQQVGKDISSPSARLPWLWRGGYLFIFLLMAAAGFLTFSKGLLFISLPVGLFLLFLFQPNLRKPILALAVFTALALIPFLHTPRLAHITSGTGRFRLYLWQSAWRMWLDHPWLGVGPDNFLYAYRSTYILPAAWEELNLSHPHNMIFDLLTRVGVMGFVAGMGLVLGVMGAGWHRLRTAIGPEHPWRPWVLGLWAGFVAGMAHGLIDNSLFLPDLMILSLLAAAVVREGDS